MAKDTVVLSPTENNTGRREGLAVGTTIQVGVLIQYVAGGVAVATAALAASMVSTENISVAGGLDGVYAVGENVFGAALPRGTLCNLKAVDGTYNPGDLLEVGAAGELTALAAGVAVAVVPSFGGETITGTASLMVELV